MLKICYKRAIENYLKSLNFFLKDVLVHLISDMVGEYCCLFVLSIRREIEEQRGEITEVRVYLKMRILEEDCILQVQS